MTAGFADRLLFDPAGSRLGLMDGFQKAGGRVAASLGEEAHVAKRLVSHKRIGYRATLIKSSAHF
jgi:hypothetical protein